MQVILRPSNGKLACIVDTNTGEILREIDIPDGLMRDTELSPNKYGGAKNRPYGITKDGQGNWYISNWDRIGVFDEDFNFKFTINNLPENIHQIHYDIPSEELWVCATSLDSLLSINLAGGFIRRFCLKTNKWVELDEPGSDTEHFSSVHWYGSTLYVLAHKKGLENSCLLTYDRAMNLMGAWRAGWEGHSICYFNQHIYIVDSKGGRILGTNGTGIPLGDGFDGVRNENYFQGEVSYKYARGMAINERGVAVTCAFDFGNDITRSNGDAVLMNYNISDRQLLWQTTVKGVGNVQDIQIYKNPYPTIYGDIGVYQPVIDKLNSLIPAILNGNCLNSDDETDRMPYDADRKTPDFEKRFKAITENPMDYAAQKNLKRLMDGIESEAEKLLNKISPETWKRSGGFWYPAKNGFMDWHSNHEVPGPRIYFVWCAEANKSRFLFSEDGKTVSSKIEPAGWSMNSFNIGDKSNQYWHAVDSGGTNRISFGFKTRGC